jgi:hypothetical protein
MLAEQRRAREERERLLEAEGALRLAEQRQQRRQLAAEEAERQREAAVKERLRQLKLEAARERLQEALSPLEEGARQLHAAVYEAASAIRTSLQQRGHLHGATARKARALARWFRLMSWQSDAELETLLGELEILAHRPTGKQRPDPGPLDEVLGDIIARCYADARALAEPHRLGALEL